MSSINGYDIGDKLVSYGSFTDPAESLPVDPSQVFFDYTKPDGTDVSLEYGVDPQITRNDVGEYQALIPGPAQGEVLDQAGYWSYVWRSIGPTGPAAEQSKIYVRDSITSDPKTDGYSTRQDLYNIYGTNNVNKWADLNNDGIEPDIGNRINWAITQADAEINSRLLGGPWVIPFTAPFDPVVVDLSARLAGVLLYESRGITDKGATTTNQINHALFIHRQQFERGIRQLLAGQRNLVGADKKYLSYPKNILDNVNS